MLDARRQGFRETGRSVLVLAVFVAVCFAAAGVGSLATTPQTASGGWYSTLNKPFFTPPASVFGPVWTVLYLSMAVSAWLVALGGVLRDEDRDGTVLRPTRAEPSLKCNLLWTGGPGPGVGRDTDFVDAYPAHHFHFLENKPARRMAARALPCLGYLCDGPERRYLVAQRVSPKLCI